MTYWVGEDGTITRAESQIASGTAQRDPLFAAPFQRSEIVGFNLFSFIEGMEVRHLYSLLHRRLRGDAQKMSFDYRCDSPETRRDMNMSLAREGDSIRYDSVVLKETARLVAIPSGDPDAQVFIPVCSTCCRYRFPRESTDWNEIDLLLTEKNLPEHFNFTHSVCEACYETIMGAAPVA